MSAPQKIMRYLTSAQVAEILNVRVEYVTKLCRRGELPGAFKVGRSLRIPESAIARYVASCERAAS